MADDDDLHRFAIGFDPRDRRRLHALWDEDLEAKIERPRPRACVLVHIGGHLAFASERIAAICRAAGVFLLEDCAHAAGASWRGRRPGTFGDAGVYSLYATKTISTGE